VGFIDRPLLRWRKHPNALTNTSPHWRAAALQVRANTLTDLSNTPAQRQATRLAYLHSGGLDVARRMGRSGEPCVAAGVP
jgi:hypothetical protein